MSYSFSRKSHAQLDQRQREIAREVSEMKSNSMNSSDSTVTVKPPPRDSKGQVDPFNNRILQVARPNNDPHAHAWRPKDRGHARGNELRDINNFKQLVLTRDEVEKLHESSAVCNRRAQMSGATAPNKNGMTLSWLRGGTGDDQYVEPADPRVASARQNGPRRAGAGPWRRR